MKPLINPLGITIKQLKELVSNLEEIDPISGEDYEVWINGTNCEHGLSNVCTGICRLNKGDLIFEISDKKR